MHHHLVTFLIVFFGFLVSSCGQKKNTVQPTPVPPSGGPVAPPPDLPLPPIKDAPPGVTSLDLLEDTILLDLQSQPSGNDRLNSRYIVTCDRTNQGIVSDGIEQGVNKGINMLSTERFLTKATPIGRDNCIFRIDMRDFGISREEWVKIEQNLQFQFVSQTIRAANAQFLTQTQKPWVFANDFFVTTFEADAVANKGCTIYCDIVEQPLQLQAFFAQQGIAVQREFDDQEASLAGFSQSQIALGKTRLVQILESNNGYCMTTFDVSLANQDSIFTNPFTLEAANANNAVRSNKVYKHNAQEHICQLANGLPMWRLNGADGLAAGAAPNDVVINTQFATTDPTIRIGDCGACHAQDLAIAFKDQVKSHVKTNPAFNDQEKLLAEIFFSNDRMQAVVGDVNRLHKQALATLGITATKDPVNEELIRPMRVELNAAQVASWTFLDTRTFLEQLRGTAQSSQTLGNLLNGGTVNLGTLKQAFPQLVIEMNLFRDKEL